MKTAIALGTFDGLHKGHLAVLEKTLPFSSVAVTFRIPPKAVVSGHAELLMSTKDRLEALKKIGVKQIELLDFEKVCDLSPKEFLDFLYNKFSPALISCGYNYKFGKSAAGDTEFLRKYCEEKQIEFCCNECICEGNDPINSTLLRSRLRNGETELANTQIYGGFGFSAPVIHGDCRGRKIGFPTINQKYPENLVKVKFGVYVSKVFIGEKCYDSITNIGIRPTWRTDDIMSETHIKNFSGDLYEKTVTVKLIRYIRPERQFSSLEELQNTLNNDILQLDK